MCRILVIEFFIENVRFEEFKDKRVLEVGSRYVNGSVVHSLNASLNRENI